MTKEDFENVVWQCEFLHWRFHIGEIGPVIFLQVQVDGTDNVTGLPKVWHGRQWILSPDMTIGQVVQTAFKAVLTAQEHEARECFLFAGRSIFDPHYDIDKLWILRGAED